MLIFHSAMKHQMASELKSKVSLRIQEQMLRLKLCKEATHMLDLMVSPIQSVISLTRMDSALKVLICQFHQLQLLQCQFQFSQPSDPSDQTQHDSHSTENKAFIIIVFSPLFHVLPLKKVFKNVMLKIHCEKISLAPSFLDFDSLISLLRVIS